MIEENEVRPHGDYGFLMFLTLLNVMNFVDRQLLASFANWIVPDLGLTNTQFGWLTGMIFIVFYSVAGLAMGVLADRVKPYSPYCRWLSTLERINCGVWYG